MTPELLAKLESAGYRVKEGEAVEWHRILPLCGFGASVIDIRGEKVRAHVGTGITAKEAYGKDKDEAIVNLYVKTRI